MRYLIAIFCFLLPTILMAQTKFDNAGWFSLSNSTKLSKKFTAFADVHLRTADRWAFLKQVEFSAGLNYSFLPKQEFGVGSVLTNTVEDKKSNQKENDRRVIEQYLIKHQVWNAAISHRLRLEQRFIETADEHFFAQRLRYRFEVLKPIQKIEGKFVEGFFAMLQNEVFLNVQNKEKLNGNLLDQNRLFLGGGYRLSKKLDIELGYLNKFTLKSEEKKDTHILQFALTTSF